jgi:hypothetical protein
MTPSPRKTPLDFIWTRQLGFSWAVAVILGVVVISSNAKVTPTRLTVPVLIMFCYAIVAFKRSAALFAGSSNAYKSSIDGQLADSMYFMGFIWTLWALIDSFVIHKIETGDAIFRVFGYALVTTAAGMFGRLAILQFKYTAAEQSEGANESVEDVLLRFASTLNSTRTTLDDWNLRLAEAAERVHVTNVSLLGTIESSRAELVKTTDVAMKANTVILDAMEERVGQIIGRVGADLTSSLQGAVHAGLNDFGTQTAANVTRVKEATTGLVATLKRTDTSLGKSITDLTETVHKTSRDLGSATGSVTADALAISVAFAEMADRIKASCDSMLQATDALTNDMSGFANAIRQEIILGLDSIEVSPRVAVTIDDALLDKTFAPMRSDLQELHNTTRNIEKKVETLSVVPSSDEVDQRIEKRITAAVAFVGGRLERLQQSVEEIQKRSTADKQGWWSTWNRK